MRQVLPLVILAPALAACSLIYNPNNLPNPAGIADAEIILDADPSKLELLGVAPGVINEGQGDGNSAPALVVISGHQMVDANTTVQLTPSAATPLPDGVAMPELGAPIVAKDGNWIAIPVTVHVDPKLHKDQLIKFDVSVAEDVKATGARAVQKLEAGLQVQGLEELVVTAAGSLESGGLEAMYSKIDLQADVTFTGTDRVVLVSASSIATKNLKADGVEGTTAQLGGCAGGSSQSDGGCGTALGGRRGNPAAGLSAAGGGGGGGGANDGLQAKATNSGLGGSHTGDVLVSTYMGQGNQSPNLSGGGGGGANTALGLGSGGVGGTGGGWLRIDAGGDITITGTISAKGGPGHTGGTGGGGGAGGIVVVRADGALSVTGTIAVDGGAPGATNSPGGAGSDGRVRWDAATSAGVSAPKSGSLHRGPAFVLAERVVRDNKAPINLIGAKGDQFTVRVVNFGVDGTETKTGDLLVFNTDTASLQIPPLPQGLNQICVTSPLGSPNTPEADKCAYVAYLP